jgi:hypothetical protein
MDHQDCYAAVIASVLRARLRLRRWNLHQFRAHCWDSGRVTPLSPEPPPFFDEGAACHDERRRAAF